MARLSFRAHCAKGHDRIDFTDPATFEEHMVKGHRTRRLSMPWDGKPRPWKAPRAPRDTSKLTAVLVKASDREGYPRALRTPDHLLEWTTPDEPEGVSAA